tara:strand:- start:190 stop:693 length:504 start_codon:yes stop_codon:yes gene_type:complete
MQLSDFLSNQENNRVFIFQCLTSLTDKQIDYIEEKLHNDFFPNWFSHTQKIKPELLVLYRHFIIISSCQPSISGCSIDALIKEMKILQLQLSINLFNRLEVAYLHAKKNIFSEEDNLEILFLNYKKFKTLFSKNPSTGIYVFNNSIIESYDVWIQPLDHWLKKYQSS